MSAPTKNAPAGDEDVFVGLTARAVSDSESTTSGTALQQIHAVAHFAQHSYELGEISRPGLILATRSFCDRSGLRVPLDLVVAIIAHILARGKVRA